MVEHDTSFERGSCSFLKALSSSFITGEGFELRPVGGGVTADDDEPKDSLLPMMTVSMSYQKFCKNKNKEYFRRLFLKIAS